MWAPSTPFSKPDSSTGTGVPVAGSGTINPRSYTSSLKRSHIESTTSQHEAHSLPALPPLTGDLAVEVFTHKSLVSDSSPATENYRDNTRLSELGARVLSAVHTQNWFMQKPRLNVDEVVTQRENVLSNSNMLAFTEKYKLRERLRCHPDVRPSLNTAQESRTLFHAYVGALFVQDGIQAVQEWIGKLVGASDESEKSLQNALDALSSPPPKRLKQNYVASKHLGLSIPQIHPQPLQPSAPLLNLPNPLAPAQPHLPFLPLFNQTASQRRVSVEYPAEFCGPSHAGRWIVKCVARI